MNQSDEPNIEMRRIGVDTGGTFTDCVLIDYGAGSIAVAKVPSQPHQPHQAIISGITGLAGLRAGVIESVTHGTTIATNAVITGNFARVGWITTRGFRDALEIGTQMRPRLYSLRQPPKAALIPRDLRVEVGGRIAADGEEVEPIDVAEVERAVDQLLGRGVEAIAIGTLFSFVNEDHEERIRQIAAERAPGLYVGRSAQISPEAREYPRFVTTAINAALAPQIDPYVRGLQSALQTEKITDRLFVMQSTGGITTADRSVGERVHQLILSGPAAGVIGGSDAAVQCGFDDCVTFDVGGTSADIAVVAGGRPRMSLTMDLPNGIPCTLPHIEVEAIGAGGGSLAWVDPGGGLNVGPQSAGADPGPACYGRSGTEPTVTDAHLVLGHLSPEGLIDGALPLYPELAKQALSTLGGRLGLGDEDASLGVLALLRANMAGGLRKAAARHGDDLRDFALVAGGGGGPLHAAALMQDMGMRAAIVPPHPGLLSALGLLAAHVRHDFVTPLSGLLGQLGQNAIADAFSALEGRAAAALNDDGVRADHQRFETALDLRYVGQEYSLQVPSEAEASLVDLARRFHEQHDRTFGHADEEVAIEVVTARIAGTGLRDAAALIGEPPAKPGLPSGSRRALLDAEDGWETAEIYRREALGVHQTIEGPAIVEQLDTTTLIPSSCSATVHDSGALIITSRRTK